MCNLKYLYSDVLNLILKVSLKFCNLKFILVHYMLHYGKVHLNLKDWCVKSIFVEDAV